MKVRNGFVSNSSSSSFVIAKSKLNNKQIEAIKNHRVIVIGLGNDEFDRWWGEWQIEETDTEIKGSTTQDNFNMREFLNVIGVDYTCVEWDE